MKSLRFIRYVKTQQVRKQLGLVPPGHPGPYRRESVSRSPVQLGEGVLRLHRQRPSARASFHSPEATGAIVPYLLKEVWESHNAKQAILMEIGQLGSVSGDVFVKVAYEPPFVDTAGLPHEGRIRILPINPAFAFPEFHPHDRTRMIR
jgi:hypothetical protein